MVASQPAAGTHFHPRLVEAAIALNENRLDVAERLLKPYLKEDPFDAAAIRMLAELAARIGRLTDAENLLRRAIEIAPGFEAAKTNLALILGRTGRAAQALELLDDIFAVDQDDVGVLTPGDPRLPRALDVLEIVDADDMVVRAWYLPAGAKDEDEATFVDLWLHGIDTSRYAADTAAKLPQTFKVTGSQLFDTTCGKRSGRSGWHPQKRWPLCRRFATPCNTPMIRVSSTGTSSPKMFCSTAQVA